MAAGFKVRKIKASSQSIGDALKRARTRLKYSIGEVEEATKIRSKFLLALEGDSWEQIPSEVYGRGYLERYATFLQLPAVDLMQQYDRERHLYAQHCQDAKVALAPRAAIKPVRPFLTMRALTIGLAACLVLGFAGVVAYQVERFTKAPFLQLATPAQAEGLDASLHVKSDSLQVSGRTLQGASVSVNGVAAAVAPDGRFSQRIRLEPGLNAVLVQATSSRGKTTSEVLSVLAD